VSVYTKTVEIAPLPHPDPFERFKMHLRQALDFAGFIGADIEEATAKLLASACRREIETKGRAA
jgi:hypothetical protein